MPSDQRPPSTSFKVKVHPRAKKNAITGMSGDALKLSLTAPPLDGKANQACIEFFAKLLKLPRSSITIAAGLTSRNKVVQVEGLSAQQLLAWKNELLAAGHPTTPREKRSID